MSNFTKICHLKMVFEDNFLTLTVTVRLKKNEYFKSVDFVTLFYSVKKYLKS